MEDEKLNSNMAQSSTSEHSVVESGSRHSSFRFMDLPFDIKKIIYDLCLTTSETIVMGRERSTMTENPNFNKNLLRVNKDVYLDGCTVMLTQNAYQFHGGFGSERLNSLCNRLTDDKRSLPRSISVEIPQFRYFLSSYFGSSNFRCESNVDAISEQLAAIIRMLKGLKNLTLFITQDILASDFTHLYNITASTDAKITLRFWPSFNSCRRSNLRVHKEALTKAELLGWKITGDVETVDENHRLWVEYHWIRDLEREEDDYYSDLVRESAYDIDSEDGEVGNF